MWKDSAAQTCVGSGSPQRSVGSCVIGTAPCPALGGRFTPGQQWWVIVAARAPPPYRPHVIAVWVPAVLPVGLVLWPPWGPDDGVDNGIGIVVMAPLAAVTLLLCAAGALTLRINRQEDPAEVS